MVPQRWLAVIHCWVGTIAPALPTLICFRLRLNFATTTYQYLTLIVLLSLRGSFFSSATRVEENE